MLCYCNFIQVYEALEYNLEPSVLTLMNSLKKSAENLSLRVMKDEERLEKANWFQRTFFCLGLILLLIICIFTYSM